MRGQEIETGAAEKRPVFAGDITGQALDIAHTLAWRLADADLVDRAATQAKQDSAFPRATEWRPFTIAQGYAGLALLTAQCDRCFPGEGWDAVGRDHLTRAVRDAEQYEQLPLGLFSGITGLAFAAWELSCEGKRYERLLEKLDAVILRQARQAALHLHVSKTVHVGQFDAISGLSGVGAYLLNRRREAEHAKCLEAILSALVDMLLPLPPAELPRWYTPFEYLYDDRTRAVYPLGNLNCGLAHGIPGPLALLSIAYAGGLRVAKIETAIAYTADWLCGAARCDDAWGMNWPYAVPVRRNAEGTLVPGHGDSAPDGPSRAAWCYGAPGVARALWLAGQALDCDRYREVAVQGIRAVFRRPLQTRHIDSPSFCHGLAGLLEVALRFQRDLEDPDFEYDCRALLEQLIAGYSPRSLLGFRHIETGTHEIDQPGLLDGTPGIALTLLAASTRVAPSWDRLFLLS